ncbi:MAG: GNAT family N-acetyltransferase [Chitinophagaceae bacterium]|nr:GNAT family N-acetyltransferase [Oligoflexus sp.]
MTLYRHYKNKPYKFMGVVKHSESLEDLVLYETLYDNPLGKFWVRPKIMFFESIEHDGMLKPRFEKVLVDIKNATSFDGPMRSLIGSLAAQCFPEWNEMDFEKRLKTYDHFQIAIAQVDGKAVAFKIGYPLSTTNFYSWLGAVIPEYEGTGIATILMKAQHEWAVSKGFHRIRTKCLNFNKTMLILNLKHGFEVIDTELTEQGLKLILEKRLLEGEYS